jgi:hypothetical protein
VSHDLLRQALNYKLARVGGRCSHPQARRLVAAHRVSPSSHATRQASRPLEGLAEPGLALRRRSGTRIRYAVHAVIGSLGETSQIIKVLEELRSGCRDVDVAVYRLRTLLGQYPFVFSARWMLYLKLTDAGRLPEALDALERAITNVHPWDGRLLLERERGAF